MRKKNTLDDIICCEESMEMNLTMKMVLEVWIEKESKWFQVPATYIKNGDLFREAGETKHYIATSDQYNMFEWKMIQYKAVNKEDVA